MATRVMNHKLLQVIDDRQEFSTVELHAPEILSVITTAYTKEMVHILDAGSHLVHSTYTKISLKMALLLCRNM